MSSSAFAYELISSFFIEECSRKFFVVGEVMSVAIVIPEVKKMCECVYI